MDSEQEKTINSIVYQYLFSSNYPDTCKVFSHECEIKGFPQTSQDVAQDTERIEKLNKKFLAAMSDGDRDTFFSLWDDQFNESTRNSDAVYQKIEFQMSIYFAIFPIHNFISSESSKNYTLQYTMDLFKQYLETRGSQLCKSTQFLCYYALPYVPDPRKHPSFKDLFTELWVSELTERLTSFLTKSLSGKGKPRILELIHGNDAHNTEEYRKQIQEIKQLKKESQELKKNGHDMTLKHRQLQTEYQGLITIASELVQSLAACVNGQPISPSYLASICQRLSALKKGYKQPVRPIETSLPIPKSISPPLKIKNNQPLTPTPQQYIDKNSDSVLDYTLLKQDMLSSSEDSDRSRALLFQALRQRVSNTATRKDSLLDIIKNDILNLKSGMNIPRHILSKNYPLSQEQLAKFMNVIASDCTGREYLMSNSCILLPDLLEAVKKELDDTFYRQNLLGLLQKLSLRRVPQSIMNQNEMINFLLNLFEDLDSLSEYSIEYGSALLMNLCLRTTGKKTCIEDPSRTLRILNELMEHDNLQVKTYVNGTLFSILSEPTIREEARAIGMEEQLIYIKEESDEQLVRQIDFVLEKLNSEEVEETFDDISVDGDELDDIDEDEDNQTVMDENDAEDLLITDADVNGETLLAKYRNEIDVINVKKPSTKKLVPKASVHNIEVVHKIEDTRTIKKNPVLSQASQLLSDNVIDLVPEIINREEPLPFVSEAVKPKGKVPVTADEKYEFEKAFSTRPKLPRTPQSNTPYPIEDEQMMSDRMLKGSYRNLSLKNK